MPRKSHRQRIHDAIRQRILNGEINTEDRLVDTAIAEEMGVSRMPVREAMMQLVSEGYLEGTTRGFILPNLPPHRVKEFFVLRRLLEPYAAASAAQVLTSRELEVLEGAAAKTAETLEDGDFETFYRASEEFRNAWVKAVPNGELRAAIQRYSGQVQTVRLATMRDGTAHKTIVHGQRLLLDAFLCHDALAAQERMLAFVLEGEQAFQRIVGR